MKFKVLGGGCKNCEALIENLKSALVSLNIDGNIEKVTDFVQIANYGIMSTPALVINEKVISYGKVLKVGEIEKLIKKLLVEE